MIATAEPATSGEEAALGTAPDWAVPGERERMASPRPGRRPPAEALEQVVRRRIDQRTWGRLRQLEVRVDAQRVLVRGSSPTYYLEQLAIAAVQEALPGTPVELDILVARSEPALATAGSRREGLLA